ncbi:DUF1349 domain-containing protein [Enterococcus sp. LJL128]
MIIMKNRTFNWLDETGSVIKSGNLTMEATPQSDYFIDPADGKEGLNAPFLYTELTGDFILSAKVTADFDETYDGCGLMFLENTHLWGKLCFELTDLGTKSVVSVVTNRVSDDANGVELSKKQVWLQVSRKGQLFAMHYSLDGSDYRMVRYFSLPCSQLLKVGFVAQAPIGNGRQASFEDIRIEEYALENMRKGK